MVQVLRVNVLQDVIVVQIGQQKYLRRFLSSRPWNVIKTRKRNFQIIKIRFATYSVYLIVRGAVILQIDDLNGSDVSVYSDMR